MVYEKVSNILISIIFLIYNVFIIKYVVALFTKQKSNNNLILVYWLDYIIIIFSLFIISILFTIDLYINDNSKKASNVLVIDSDDFFPLLFESNFIIDILLSIQLLIKIRKMKKIKLKYLDLIKMNKFIEKLDILSNYKIIQHLTLLLISYLINIFIIIISDYAIDKEKKNLFIKLFQIILFVLTITIMLFLSNRNKTLISHQIFFENNVIEKLYNSNRIKLVASSEHLMNKFIFDLLINIPCITKIFYNSSYSYKLTYYYSIIFSGFLYLFFFGIMLLYIDSTNFTLLPCPLKFLFCTKHFNFYFGDGKKILIRMFSPDNIDIFNYNVYFNKSKMFTSQEDFINKLNGINGYSETTISSIFEGNDLVNNSFEDNEFINTHLNMSESIDQTKKIDEKIKEMEKQKIKKETEYGPCNFFIIYKLLYLYYNSNIEVYNKIKKKAEENGLFIDDPNKNKQSNEQKIYGRFSNSNCSSRHKLSYANLKDKLNTLTKAETEQSSSAYKSYNINDVMGNIQEFNMKTVFIKYLSKNLDKTWESKEISNNKKGSEITTDFKNLPSSDYSKDNIKSNNITNDYSNFNINSTPLLSLDTNNINNEENFSFYEFKIESLMNFALLDLFPFYEIDIKDIINSLDVNNNMYLFETFFRKKNDDKNFNSYYTYDSFLSLEIYDSNFISYKELKVFMTNYKQYFLDKISNFGFTFLPLIIGIFKISYLSYNKIVFVLRNPLAFTPDASFHYWVKYIFSEDNEKMETSVNNNEIVDLNEIEILNILKLNKDDYLDTIKILDEDLNFLNNVDFNLDFKLNLFILNNLPNNNNDEENIINNQDQNNINKNNITTENANLMNIIRNTELFPGNNTFEPYNFRKKIFGSESISLLENLFTNDSANNNYSFKIYFCEIFKKKIFEKKKSSKKIKNINKENYSINDTEERYSQGISNNNNSSSSNIDENEIKEYNQKLCNNIKNKMLQKIGKSENALFE